MFLTQVGAYSLSGGHRTWSNWNGKIEKDKMYGKSLRCWRMGRQRRCLLPPLSSITLLMWMADVLGNLSNGTIFCKCSIPLFFSSSKKPSRLFKQSNFDLAQLEFLPCYWGMLLLHFWVPYAELSKLVEPYNASYAVLFWLGTWHIFVTMIIFLRFGGSVWIKLYHWQI